MARILIGDDDGVRTVLRRMLEQAGHTVQRTPADLVITDIVMPEKEGLEVVRVLRDTHPV